MTYIILIALSIALVGSLSDSKELSRAIDGTPQFLPENPCSKRGGICGLASSCPAESQFPEKGLCPNQQTLGAECCRTVPLNIRNCGRRGGDCVEEAACGRAPREENAVCPTGEVCCIFL